MSWDRGGVRGAASGVKRRGRGVKSGAHLEAPIALLMLRTCSQRSETTSLPLPHNPSPSLSLTPGLYPTQKACGGGGGGVSRVDGSRERHGILMVVERVREEWMWWGWW